MAANTKKINNYFDGIKVTGKHKFIFFIIMLAYFFEQMDNWNFGFISSAIFKSWGLGKHQSNEAMGTIVFWYFMGMTLGGFLGGIISDAFGRRKTFMISAVLFSVSSVINGLPISNFYVFVFFRAMTGFGVFCLMVCSQAYIAEVSPSESRGKWQGLVGAVGFCAVPIIALVCRMIVPLYSDAWRIIFYLGGSGILVLFLSIRHLKESPRWLVSKGKIAEAEKVVFEITGQHISLAEAAKNIPPKTNPIKNIIDMFKPPYLKRTLVLICSGICTVPAGFMFTVWTGKLLNHVYSQETMLTVMTVISIGVPAGCYLASLIADKGGRKTPIVICFSLAGICCYLFALYAEQSYYIAAALGFLISVFNMSAGFMMFTYIAESYPTRMRNTSVGTHNAIARFAVSGSNLIWPPLLAAFGMHAGGNDVYVMFTAAAILFVLPLTIIAFFGMRTGGKSLEEIA